MAYKVAQDLINILENSKSFIKQENPLYQYKNDIENIVSVRPQSGIFE